MKTLMVIDGSYNLTQIRDRDLKHVLAIRHLDGFWDRVWSVHPLDNYQSTDTDSIQFGSPAIEKIAEDHFFVRARFGLFAFLQKIASVNFVLGQIYLVFFLCRLAKREGISAVRASDPLLCGLIGLLVAKLIGVKLMIRVNGNNDALRAATGKPIMPRLFRKQSIERYVERLTLSRADFVIVPSENYLDFALSKGAKTQVCREVRYGNLIDSRHIDPKETRQPLNDPILHQRPFLLYIGRLEKLKHTEDCLKVLESLILMGHDINLCLVGDGSQKDSLLEIATELNIVERVHFLGNQNQGYLSRIIPMASAVLSPITGRALSEVAFGEAPIIAYDLDWQSELIVNGVSGFLVPPLDVEHMASRTDEVLKNIDLAHRLGKGARKQAFAILEPQEQTKKEIQAYKDMLDLSENV
jgi:glycosyltransferase involved in cell wall biosynthesis